MPDVVTFPRPSPERLRLALSLLEPWRRYTRPVFVGMERVPTTRPLLFVGNHTLMGVLDAPLLFAELHERHGIFLRSLGDHAHFRLPVWRSFLRRYGVVDGTRENAAALMRAGEATLVFPGGAREVAKRKGEKYRLLWGERAGFARLCIEHGCTIVPFAAVGVEDAFDIVLDADEYMDNALGRRLLRAGVRRDFLPPIVRGIGPTPPPPPPRLDPHPAERIDPRAAGTDPADSAAVNALRDATRKAVEDGIESLLQLREIDPQRVRLRPVLDGVRARPRRAPDAAAKPS